MYKAVFSAVLASIAVSAAAVSQAPKVEQLDLTFGVYTSDKATTMYRMFTPLLEHLQERVEKSLRRSVSIELKIYKTYAKALESFVKGEVDMVRFGPASYVLATERNAKIELLAMELKKGKKSFKGMIVVRSDSPIRKVEDLEGRTFAFGDRNSTIGRYLAQDRLLCAGIDARKLTGYAFLGRHDMVFRAVEHDDYAAGSVKEKTFHSLNKKNQLRVLATFDNVTKPWVARSGLDPRVVAALRSALLSTREESAIAGLKVDGFVAATSDDYEPIRKVMKRAQSFERKPAKPRK